MHLEVLTTYKKKLAELLVFDKEIVSLVTKDPNPTIPAYSLLDSAFIPHEPLKELPADINTFICFDVDVLASDSKILLAPVLNIWVFSSTASLVSEEGVTLPDKLSSRIDELLNTNPTFGLGVLELSSVVSYTLNERYAGHVLTFLAKEFKHRNSSFLPANQKQPVPSNV